MNQLKKEIITIIIIKMKIMDRKLKKGKKKQDVNA